MAAVPPLPAPHFSGATIGTEELAALAGYQPSQRQAITSWLRDHRVRYFSGRKGPWTTVRALNHALGIGPNGNTDDEAIRF